VLTGDTDFDPLHPELVTREWIDERSLESDAPRADEAP
jgi:hypothetical protein